MRQERPDRHDVDIESCLANLGRLTTTAAPTEAPIEIDLLIDLRRLFPSLAGQALELAS
jgi:hypothetical protein